jgi:hypothetical protein
MESLRLYFLLFLLSIICDSLIVVSCLATASSLICFRCDSSCAQKLCLVFCLPTTSGSSFKIKGNITCLACIALIH